MATVTARNLVGRPSRRTTTLTAYALVAGAAAGFVGWIIADIGRTPAICMFAYLSAVVLVLLAHGHLRAEAAGRVLECLLAAARVLAAACTVLAAIGAIATLIGTGGTRWYVPVIWAIATVSFSRSVRGIDRLLTTTPENARI